MVKITREDVLKLAKLSKLEVKDEEIEGFVKELNSVMEYVEQINTVDTSGLETTDQVTGLKNVSRKDEIIDYKVSKKELLKNVPDVEKGQIKVKRILN